jgi:hypothetical protein
MPERWSLLLGWVNSQDLWIVKPVTRKPIHMRGAELQ